MQAMGCLSLIVWRNLAILQQHRTVDALENCVIIIRPQYIVRCLYNAVNLLTNIPNRHPIARLLGQGMGCLLWIQHMIVILPHLISYDIRPRYNGTWLYHFSSVMHPRSHVSSSAYIQFLVDSFTIQNYLYIYIDVIHICQFSYSFLFFFFMFGTATSWAHSNRRLYQNTGILIVLVLTVSIQCTWITQQKYFVISLLSIMIPIPISSYGGSKSRIGYPASSSGNGHQRYPIYLCDLLVPVLTFSAAKTLSYVTQPGHPDKHMVEA